MTPVGQIVFEPHSVWSGNGQKDKSTAFFDIEDSKHSMATFNTTNISNKLCTLKAAATSALVTVNTGAA